MDVKKEATFSGPATFDVACKAWASNAVPRVQGSRPAGPAPFGTPDSFFSASMALMNFRRAPTVIIPMSLRSESCKDMSTSKLSHSCTRSTDAYLLSPCTDSQWSTLPKSDSQRSQDPQSMNEK